MRDGIAPAAIDERERGNRKFGVARHPIGAIAILEERRLAVLGRAAAREQGDRHHFAVGGGREQALDLIIVGVEVFDLLLLDDRLLAAREVDADPAARRSAEHTSELPSLMRISYAVVCLQQKQNNINN